MSKIAVITARGGSKRIPQKNIKTFSGMPIIYYSIKAAINSNLFDVVMVSTDDKEIADISKRYGAEVPFYRSSKNSDDYTGTDEVLKEVLLEYKKMNREFDFLCCIYPTAPFVTAQKLSKAYQVFCESNAEALVSVVKYSYPPQRCFIINDLFLQYKWKENIMKRSQDLEDYYHDAGQFYFWQVDSFFSNINSMPVKTVPYVLNEMEVQDIDTMEDWKIAELKYKIFFQNKELE